MEEWMSDTIKVSTKPDDPPDCDVCGAITIVSGDCYKCLNCGNSMAIPKEDQKDEAES
jgi:hypothetical protein